LARLRTIRIAALGLTHQFEAVDDQDVRPSASFEHTAPIAQTERCLQAAGPHHLVLGAPACDIRPGRRQFDGAVGASNFRARPAASRTLVNPASTARRALAAACSTCSSANVETLHK
jgi:hypothetical protein